jgi:hypothetical protein
MSWICCVSATDSDNINKPLDPGQNSFNQGQLLRSNTSGCPRNSLDKQKRHCGMCFRERMGPRSTTVPTFHLERTPTLALKQTPKPPPRTNEQNVNTTDEQTVSIANEREEKAPPKKSIDKTRRKLEDSAATTPKRKGKKRGRKPKPQTEQTRKRLCRRCYDRCSRHKGGLCGSCYLATQN